MLCSRSAEFTVSMPRIRGTAGTTRCSFAGGSDWVRGFVGIGSVLAVS